MTRLTKPGFCGSTEHVTRRGFLGTAAAGAAAAGLAQDMTVLDVLKNPLVAAEVKKNQKSVILLWLAGGASQLETWDPKPGRPTGGPFRPISTNATGVQISELLPKMSQRMQDTAILRSLSTGIGDHGGPGIEGEALVVVDVGAAARLVALLQQRRLDAGALQADRQRQPAETGTDHHRPPHTACCLVHRLSLCRLLAASARSASPTGTGGLPETMRKRSQAVSSAA